MGLGTSHIAANKSGAALGGAWVGCCPVLRCAWQVVTPDDRYAMVPATQTAPAARLLTDKCPRALRAGNIVGHGSYALASCPDAQGIRRIHLFETSSARSRALKEWEGRGPQDYVQCSNWTTCYGDHELFEVVDNR